jgi:hypothetical protein
MRRNILITAFFILTTIFSYAYELKGNAVVFTKIIEGTGNVEQTHSNLESFFAIKYNDVNSTIKLNQVDKLIYKGIFKDLGSYAMGMWTIDANHTIEVAIKENRVRVKIMVSEAIFRSTGNSLAQYEYSVPNSAPFTKKCSNSSVSKKSCETAFLEIEKRAEALLLEITQFLISDNNTFEDEW